jgi:DNA-directed RNA polymerase sigma subunit (sigma70/sigma32)
MSWAEIGEELGISGERTRQIAASAIVKIRKDLAERGLSEDDFELPQHTPTAWEILYFHG